MKVAQYSLYFYFFIFLVISVFSEAYAKEASTLNLRGFVEPVFSVELESAQRSYRLTSQSNFDFYGKIESDGLRIIPGQLLTIKNKKIKKITVSIN